MEEGEATNTSCMKLRTIILLTLILPSICADSFSQDEPFKGGPGDGYADKEILDTTFIFSEGGSGDGYAAKQVLNNVLNFTLGGTADGATEIELQNSSNKVFSGGVADGASGEQLQNQNNKVFSGGKADGYAFFTIEHIIYWTGNVGTGWNVAGNWENEIIPNYCNPVVIPANVPNYPAINQGLFRIGYYNNSADYNCAKIKVEAGAELTIRVSCFVENYSTINNFGTIYVKNSALNAFQNKANAQLRLKPNSSMIFQPNQ